MLIHFKVVGGRSVSLETDANIRISDLKRELSHKLGISSVQISLILAGVKLDNSRILASYNTLTNNATINVILSKLPVFELKLKEYFSGITSDPDQSLNEFSRLYQEYLDSLNLNQIDMLCKNLL